MKYIFWLIVVVWMSAAAGCDSEPESTPLGDPIGFTFEATPGSFSSFGWTGEVHNRTEPPGTPFGVQVTDCENNVCRFEGPTDPRGDVQRRRCVANTSMECTTDDDCPLLDGTPSLCAYIYGAPVTTGLQGANGKFGACAWTFIPPLTIEGTLNLTSGDLNLERFSLLLSLNGKVDRTFYGACAECVGDLTPNDGLREGTCQTATHKGPNAAAPEAVKGDGIPCDVNRTGTVGGYAGNYSMDCAPTVEGRGAPLELGAALTSTGLEVSLSDESPDCTSGGKCFCGMCPDNLTACSSNAQCGGAVCSLPTVAQCNPNPPPKRPDGTAEPEHNTGFAIGECKNMPKRFMVESDRCAGECVWDDATGLGTCMSQGPNSHPIGCYPSQPNATISASGRAQRVDHLGMTYRVETANARCIPAGDFAGLNSQVGLPGLLFQKRNFQIIPEYAENKK